MALIINGVGASSGGASALGDLSDIGTMGESIGQADNLTEVVTAMGGASAVRTAIDAAEDGAATPTLADVIAESTTSHAGSTFTASNGLGTATPSTLTLAYAPGVGAASWANYCKLTLDVGDTQNIDVRARLAVASGDGYTYAAMGLRDASGAPLLWAQAARGSGVVDAFDNSGSIVTSASGRFLFDGSDWFRFVVQNGRTSVFTGRTSGSDVLWTRLYPSRGGSDVIAEPASPHTFTKLVFHVHQSGGGAAITVQWADVSSVALGGP